MADKINPKVKLKCKWCGETFITELYVPVETKGELKCSTATTWRCTVLTIC